MHMKNIFIRRTR